MGTQRTEHRAFVLVPGDWRVESRSRIAGFVTRERYLRPDGSTITWESRRHRKGTRPDDRIAWSLGWWIAVSFMIGSFLFALGVVPPYAEAAGPGVDAATFFVGSIFFTSAGALQFVQTVNAPESIDEGAPGHLRLFAWQPERIDWWASGVQSIGTILFNVSTFAATLATLDAAQEHRLVWAPDMLGSVAFMIASSLAWLEVCHRWFAWRPGDVGWWIVAMNLGGSIAFQISAIAAYVDPDNGQIANLPVANLGTFVGAVGFFVGALLLLPEMARDRAAPAPLR